MSIKQRVMLAGLVVLLVLLPVLAGCGQLDINLHTTVKTSGDIIQEVRFEGSGMMATMMEEADFTEGFQDNGWDFDIERSDDSVAVTATREFARDENIFIPDIEGGEPTALGRVSLRTNDGLLTREYFVELEMPGTGEEMESGDGELDEMAEMMLQDIFNISWTLTLPGQIVESNADEIEGGSATWNFGIDSMAEGHYLTVHSRYTNWPVLGGIIAAVVVVLGVVIFFLVRRRGTPASGSVSQSTPPIP